MANPLPALSLLETRVLGTLVEKEHTVPDSYPLTLNALVSGCKQKTSRLPVMEATEAEVQAGIDSLKSRNLVMETSGGREPRYAHNLERVLQVPSRRQPCSLPSCCAARRRRGSCESAANGCTAFPISRRCRVSWRNWPPDRLDLWRSSCRGCPGRGRTAGLTC